MGSKVWHDLRGVDDVSVFYDHEYFDGEGEGYRGYSFKSMRRGFQSKVQDVKVYCKQGSILDVGCAKGFFVKIALDEGYDSFGIDFSQYAIAEAKKFLGSESFRVACVDVEKEPLFWKNSFDVVTAWDFLEHLKDPIAFLIKAHSWLRKDGYLFLTTVNYSGLMARLMRENWRLKASLHISYMITPKLLKAWLKNAKFRPVKMSSFMLNLKPLPKKMQLIEKILTKTITAGTPLLRVLNLGDALYCIAQKI